MSSNPTFDPRRRLLRQALLHSAVGATLLAASPAGAVVNGTPAPMFRFGATVQVGGGCGGTLIDPSWVLTAAHCVFSETNPSRTLNPSQVTIRYGSATRGAGAVAPVDFVYKHEKFSGNGFIPFVSETLGFLDDQDVDLGTAKWDIALIRLATPITSVTPMQMSFTRPANGSLLRFAGWGNTVRSNFTSNSPSPLLLEGFGALQPSVFPPNVACAAAGVVGLMCAAGDSAMCAGDSGGPLQSNGDLVGVFTIADCRRATAGVPLWRHQAWIENVMEAVPAGSPVPTCNGLHPTMIGTMGDDVLAGTPRDDVIIGRGGNDEIFGAGGDDMLCGMNGNDEIDGDAGDDVIFGGSGSDDLRGSGGDDLIMGGPGNDDLKGGDGRDELWGEDGVDLLEGGSNDDELHGGNHNDTLLGQWGRDDIFGDDGADVIRGGRDADTIFGGPGDDDIEGNEHVDVIQGDAGDDTINGNGGGDELRGGSGDDILNGGNGGDTIIGGPGYDTANGGWGNDTCTAEQRSSC